MVSFKGNYPACSFVENALFVVLHSCLEQVIHFTYSDSGTWSMLCSVRIALQMNSVPAPALCMFTQAHHFQLSVFTILPGTRLQNIVLISLEQGQVSLLSVAYPHTEGSDPTHILKGVTLIPVLKGVTHTPMLTGMTPTPWREWPPPLY